MRLLARWLAVLLTAPALAAGGAIALPGCGDDEEREVEYDD